MRSLHERVPTAERYYRLTQDSFRALCAEESGHMNMGIWPSTTLREAQERLVGAVLDRVAERWASVGESAPPKGILDLGSGWGGSRPLFHAALPGTPYFGINVSPDQIRVARSATAHVPRTEYIQAAVEDRDALPWSRVDVVSSIEAAFHFEDKAGLLREAARQGVRLVTLAEICVENERVLENPLLVSSLRHAWSVSRYERTFEEVGFGKPVVEDIAGRVFAGFVDYLRQLDGAPYRGRRAVLDQVCRATELLAAAAGRGEVRYVLLSN